MKAYKVLRRTEDGKLVSCKIDGYLQVEYKENEWTEPKIGGLLAFRSKEDSDKFIRIHQFYGLVELWECEIYKRKHEHNLMWYGSAHISKKIIVDFLRDRKRYGGKDGIPKGTIFCKKIKLIRRVTV